MPRHALVALALSCLVCACVTSKPAVELTPEQRKSRDVQIRALFAKVIAGHSVFGLGQTSGGERTYLNAQVSGPAVEKGSGADWPKLVCAKVRIQNLGVRSSEEVQLSGSVLETDSGVRIRMVWHEDADGARCSGPYVPFPELEAYSRPAG